MARIKIKTKDELRKIAAMRQMLSVQLWAHLRNLLDDILKGDISKLEDFREAVNCAPPEMKVNLLKELDDKRFAAVS